MEKTELTPTDLALYLGCECKTQRGFGVIDAVSRERIRVEIDGSGAMIFPPDDVKPILRPLSDISEAELIEFAKICSGSESAYPVPSAISNYKNVICMFPGDGKEHLIINETGETWYASYFGGDGDGGRNTIRQHEQTRYLISHGFDLFCWIPAGLAIDKTKL